MFLVLEGIKVYVIISHSLTFALVKKGRETELTKYWYEKQAGEINLKVSGQPGQGLKMRCV